MQKQSELLAIFLPGPDEYHAMPDMETATGMVAAQKGAPLPDEKSQERARTMCGHAPSCFPLRWCVRFWAGELVALQGVVV